MIFSIFGHIVVMTRKRWDFFYCRRFGYARTWTSLLGDIEYYVPKEGNIWWVMEDLSNHFGQRK